jgi:hypothetical protein
MNMKIDGLEEKVADLVERFQRAEVFMVCSELRDGVRHWREKLDSLLDYEANEIGQQELVNDA